MVYIYGFQGRIREIEGSRGLFEFSDPADPTHLQEMWVDLAHLERRPPPSPELRYTGGGVVACHACGNAFHECECSK